MPVLKIKKDGVWTETISAISDADTLDGKHADAFALAEDVDALRELVGGTAVSENFVVTITSNDDDTYSADKTFAEVTAAIEAGNDVLAVWCPSGNHTYLIPLIVYSATSVYFQADLLGQSSVYFRFDSDETIELTEFAYETTEPIPTSVASVKDGNSVTVTTTYDDNSTDVVTITLDDNDYPISVVKDGVECTLAWDGFN